MKFTTKIVVILFIILVSLGVFLYFLNDLTKKQEKDEKEEERLHKEKRVRKTEEKIQRRMEKNRELDRLFESFLAMPFSEADSEYGKLNRGEGAAAAAAAPPEAEVDPGCPDILIHRGDVVVLYNSKMPGKPVEVFKNLDDYAAYVHKQQAAGVFCPVLYLRKEIDLQGRDTYRMYPLYIPHQVSIYDQYTHVGGGALKKEGEPKIAPLPSVHYPIEDGDRWANGGADRPSMPMPPPFLKSMTTWELHNMPPLYVEGGLPPIPMESRKKAGGGGPIQEIADVKEIPTPMGQGSVIAAASFPEQGAGVPTASISNYDPYAMKEDPYVPAAAVKTPPPGTYSDNAADPNWGGVLYTSANVEAGKYDNNAVKPAIYPNLGFV